MRRTSSSIGDGCWGAACVSAGCAGAVSGMAAVEFMRLQK
jgi:hypothetical protein